MNKSEWLKLWGYNEGTEEADQAWDHKLNHRPSRGPMIISSASYEYACPITGNPISSKREHEENLKRQDCRVLESGEKEYNAKRNAEADAALDRAIDQTVEREIDAMPGDKRDSLAKELATTDITIARG